MTHSRVRALGPTANSLALLRCCVAVLLWCCGAVCHVLYAPSLGLHLTGRGSRPRRVEGQGGARRTASFRSVCRLERRACRKAHLVCRIQANKGRGRESRCADSMTILRGRVVAASGERERVASSSPWADPGRRGQARSPSRSWRSPRLAWRVGKGEGRAGCVLIGGTLEPPRLHAFVFPLALQGRALR